MLVKEHLDALKLDRFLSNLETIPTDEWITLFDDVDANGDGAISFDELCNYATSQMNIQPMDFLTGEECSICDIERPLHIESVAEALDSDKMTLETAVKNLRIKIGDVPESTLESSEFSEEADLVTPAISPSVKRGKDKSTKKYKEMCRNHIKQIRSDCVAEIS